LANGIHNSCGVKTSIENATLPERYMGLEYSLEGTVESPLFV
jgi:hypothetical protein